VAPMEGNANFKPNGVSVPDMVRNAPDKSLSRINVRSFDTRNATSEYAPCHGGGLGEWRHSHLLPGHPIMYSMMRMDETCSRSGKLVPVLNQLSATP
jgi:hypothetical protein